MRTVDIFSTCSQEVLLGFLTYIFFLGHKEFSVRLFKDNLLKCIFEMRYYWFRYGKMLFETTQPLECMPTRKEDKCLF
jgi:hypothetical protein